MEINMVKYWIRIYFLVVIYGQVLVASKSCPYTTASGQLRIRYCKDKCCSDSYSGQICCDPSYPYGPFVGAGIGAVIILAVVALCTMYVCCKRKINESYRRTNASCSSRTRASQTRRRDNIPSVSVSVEPTLPPPYESLPPPYYTNELEMGEHSDETKDTTKKYPDYPPPEYSENVT